MCILANTRIFFSGTNTGPTYPGTNATCSYSLNLKGYFKWVYNIWTPLSLEQLRIRSRDHGMAGM